MENDELKRFYEFAFLPYLNNSRDGAKEGMEKAEKYFADLLSIIITLSTALIAFIGATEKIFLAKTDPSLLMLLLEVFVFVIFLAIITKLSLALHYKKYTDEIANDLKSVLVLSNNQKWDDVKTEIEKKQSRFFKTSDAGWQHITIAVGSAAILIFFANIYYLVKLISI